MLSWLKLLVASWISLRVSLRKDDLISSGVALRLSQQTEKTVLDVRRSKKSSEPETMRPIVRAEWLKVDCFPVGQDM